jgi:glycosyltransferase family protein
MDYNDKRKSIKYFERIKNIWDEREVVIVERKKRRLGVGNDLFENSKSIQRIICPSINAFSNYTEILNEVKKLDKSKLILIALGPTATVLAYDLSIAGYQAIDIGHIDIVYEWYLKKSIIKLLLSISLLMKQQGDISLMK